MSVTREFELDLCSRDGSNDTLSPVVQGNIMLSINIQYRSKTRFLIFVFLELLFVLKFLKSNGNFFIPQIF